MVLLLMLLPLLRSDVDGGGDVGGGVASAGAAVVASRERVRERKQKRNRNETAANRLILCAKCYIRSAPAKTVPLSVGELYT